jgi:signal transduction protein with GAF and PtsI domain
VNLYDQYFSVVLTVQKIGEGLISLNRSAEGAIRVVDSIQDVLSLLKELKAEEAAGGVTPKIVLVEDAGTTTLAPVLSRLSGVVCTSGALGSHLAIVTREFEIPALMGTDIPFDKRLAGKRVRIEPLEGTTGALFLLDD